MIFVGWYVSRRMRDGEAFLMGGRKLGLVQMLGTVVATLVGTGSSMGAVAYGYRNGWGGALYGIGGGSGVVILTLLFSGMRKYNFMTMTEEIAFYYGANRTIKGVVSVVLYLASIGWLGAHIIGGSFYLSWISGMDLLTCKVITTAGFGLYVVIGGYLAVVWTDTIQSVILFLGFIIMAIFAISAAGGFEGIRAAVPAENLSFLGTGKSGWIHALSLAVSISVGAVSVPSYRQRLYSAKTIVIVRRSFYLSAVAYFSFSILPVIVGLSAYTIEPNLANSNMAFPFMATRVLPSMLGAFVLIGGLSATMSSGDSDALTGVTILLRDVWVFFFGRVPDKDSVVKISRWAIVASLGLAFSFGFFAEDVLGYISKMISTLMSGICVAVVLGRLWKRATWQGALAALITGSAVSIVIMSVPSLIDFWGNPILPALAFSSVAHIVTSSLTPRRVLTEEQILNIINEERRAMGI
jgi:SSS family solute:Na+ symporter